MKVKLTESKLKQIVAESVKRVLKESDWRTDVEAVKQTKKTKDSHKESARKIFGNQMFYLIKNDRTNLGVTNNKDFAYELANDFKTVDAKIEKIDFDTAYEISKQDELVIRRFYHS